MNEAYRQLIDQFCRAENVPRPDKLDGLMSLVVNDVLFFLSPVDDGDGVRLLLTVHYGEMPAQAPALAYRRLLEANVQAFDSLQPKFGMDAETGSVVVSGTLPLKAMTAESLKELINEQAMYASDWRRTTFLTPEDTAAQKAPASAQASSDTGTASSARSTLLRLQPSPPRR